MPTEDGILGRDYEMRQYYSRTILVVEDDITWQTNLQILCESAGYHVVSAYDASEALLRSCRLDPAPVLALVDLELPSSTPQSAYDGFEVLTACRALGLYTIVVSAHLDKLRDILRDRPEVAAVVDKYRFRSSPDYATAVFIPTVHEAVAFAEAARRAEGQSPERQRRLAGWQFPPPCAPEGK